MCLLPCGFLCLFSFYKDTLLMIPKSTVNKMGFFLKTQQWLLEYVSHPYTICLELILFSLTSFMLCLSFILNATAIQHHSQFLPLLVSFSFALVRRTYWVWMPTLMSLRCEETMVSSCLAHKHPPWKFHHPQDYRWDCMPPLYLIIIIMRKILTQHLSNPIARNILLSCLIVFPSYSLY